MRLFSSVAFSRPTRAHAHYDVLLVLYFASDNNRRRPIVSMERQILRRAINRARPIARYDAVIIPGGPCSDVTFLRRIRDRPLMEETTKKDDA